MELIKEDYLKIKKAMIQCARSIEEVKQKSDLIIDSPEMENAVQKVLKGACGCKSVSVEDVIQAIQNGANTVEKIGEVTGAGTGCGNCQPLLQNIIDIGK